MLCQPVFEPSDPGVELGESVIDPTLQPREPFVELVESRLIKSDGTVARGQVSEGHRSSWNWTH